MVSDRMTFVRELGDEELASIKRLMQRKYPARRIVKVFAQLHDQHLFTEEGRDLESLGVAMLINPERTDLYRKFRARELDCVVDTYPDSREEGFVVVVTMAAMPV